jgi:hypothetical protein
MTTPDFTATFFCVAALLVNFAHWLRLRRSGRIMGCCLEAHQNWAIAYVVAFVGAIAVDLLKLLPAEIFPTVGPSVLGLIFLGDIYSRHTQKGRQPKLK